VKRPERYVCIHGHFYQPPRENPWLEAIELQESAYPYHDWNERIHSECYAPNAFCRILDEGGRIERIVNNYAKISFNFGPTLLSWLEAHAPSTYEAILEADRVSRNHYSGHGSALAQVYNHAIMPLANRRDKLTQVRWGLTDFERRFGRPAEGMWLAETAVDLETLDVLAEHGIRFTVLSPYQALRVRGSADEDGWADVTGGKIDPTRAYHVELPSGRPFALFFYDGPISQAIAFEGLLASGERLADRLAGGFSKDRDWPQLLHVATDGETYGHHHRHGDMALAYALHHIESQTLATLTNYGEYLERHPPTHEVEVVENSAWSCAHGVGRWSRDCGCRMSGSGGWSQQWRGPLRSALDWLRDQLATVFELKGREFWADPWVVRDGYLEVLLNRSAGNRAAFFERHAKDPTPRPPSLVGKGDGGLGDTSPLLKLLEMQRQALLMYTSCGWFFDELSGIETVQILQYAGRAIQLAQEVSGLDLEEEFLSRLQRAKSNVPAHRNGRGVYEKFVRPARVDLAKVAAHYAVSSLFEDYPADARLFCYTTRTAEEERLAVGKARLAVGRTRVTSEVTQESAEFMFAAVHFGDHNLSGGVRSYTGADDFQALRGELGRELEQIDLPALILTLDRQFSAATYSLRSLFRDEQRKILRNLLETTAGSIELHYRHIYEQHGLMMRFVLGLDAPLPRSFMAAAEYLLNTDLRRLFEEPALDLDRARRLLEEAETFRVTLDGPGLAYALRRSVARQVARIAEAPDRLEPLTAGVRLAEWARSLPFEVDLWDAQNLFHEMARTLLPGWAARAGAGDPTAREWVAGFRELGERLRVKLPLSPQPSSASAL
jgi:alpha-amylase/alpha-mannosidase (GH57 family)